MKKFTQKRAQNSEELQTTIETRRPGAGRATAVGSGALLVLTLLAACAPNTGATPNETPTSVETVKPATQEELIQQNLANRPAVGSPEYDQRVTDRFRIPYIPGQDPAEVALKLQEAVRDYLEMGYEDGPQDRDAVLEWQVDTGGSLADLTTELDLPYFDPGFRKGTFGPAADGEFADRIVTNFAPYRVDSVALVFAEAAEPGADPIKFDPGIKSASADRIVGFSTAVYGGKSGTQELYYDLQVSDDNKNGVPDEGDSWYWAGTGL